MTLYSSMAINILVRQKKERGLPITLDAEPLRCKKRLAEPILSAIDAAQLPSSAFSLSERQCKDTTFFRHRHKKNPEM